MKKPLILLALIVVLMGCSCVAKMPELTPIEVEFKYDAITIPNYGVVVVSDGGWSACGELTFGGEIGKEYHAGLIMSDNPSYYILKNPPLYIVNRIQSVSQQGILVTDVGETTATIPLKYVLHNGDISLVKIECFVVNMDGEGRLQMTSQITNDKPVISYYSDKNIYLSNLKPNNAIGIRIIYVPDIEFNISPVYISAVPQDDAIEGYTSAPPSVVDWVSLSTTTVTVPPDSYVPFWVFLNVPEGTQLPKKWVFWLRATTCSVDGSSGIALVSQQEWVCKVIMAD